MNRTFRFDARRTLLAALSCAAGCLGATSAEAATITSQLKPEAITYGRGSVSIKGKLKGDPGISAADRKVKLYKRVYPYDDANVIARTRTNANGNYRFKGIEPDANTYYKVATSDPGVAARGKTKLVVVYARGIFRVRATADGDAAASFRLSYWPRLKTKLGDRDISWYFNKVGDPRYKVRDHSKSKLRRRGLLRGHTRFHLPPGRYRFRVSYCIDTPNQRDIGIGPPGASRECPRSFPVKGRVLRSAAVGAGALSEGTVAGAASGSATR